MIDLHLHSITSDGDLTPSEVVKKAKQQGISVLSLTDHDSISGLKEAKKTCDKLDICFIPGVELEAATDISRSSYIHILAYNFTTTNYLKDYLNSLHQERISIISKYVEILNSLGIQVSFEDISSINPGAHITAYNIPVFLYKKGYYNSFSEAKQEFINPSSKYYIPRNFYNVDYIIDLILKSGGIPVLAHPCRLPQKGKELELYVGELKKKGLMGIETIYPKHSESEIAFYKMIANKYNLLQTAGSDFHSLDSETSMGFSLSNEKQLVSMLLNHKRDS